MNFFHKLKIRTKLFILFSLLISLLAIPSGYIIYSSMRRVIKNSIHTQLTTTNLSIKRLIQSILDTGVRSHLLATARHNREIIKSLDTLARQGKLSPAAARTMAVRNLLAQKVSKTGYIYCLNSNGVIVVHPKKKLLQKNLSEYDFIKKQLKWKEGYLTYRWKNPGETRERAKALYMVYYKPWDWIISVSAYKDEFLNLIDMKALRKAVLSHKFGKTGYSYIINTKGDIIFHPHLPTGNNYYNVKDSSGLYFIREMIRKKNGSIVYDWKNPEEKKPRKKILYYRSIDNPHWIITSSGYTEELYETLTGTSSLFWTMTLFSILLAALFSAILSSYITTPLRNMIKNFQMGSQGDLNLRMPETSDDELGELSRYFNSFMEKLNEIKLKDEQLLRAQKMEIVGTLAGGVAHDFNNYLGGIMGAVSIIEHKNSGDNTIDRKLLTKYISLMRKSAEKAKSLVNQLLTISNRSKPSLSKQDLNTIITNAVTLSRTVLDKSISIKTELYKNQSPVFIDSGQIEQAFLNLFINSAHAMTIMRQEQEEWGGTLEIAVSEISIDDAFRNIHPEATKGHYWVVSIRDNGVGMSPEILQKIFQPFFSTKKKNEGSGLGLPMVFNIIRQHNGFTGVYSEPGLGTEFNIYLPVCRSLIPSENNTEAKPEINGDEEKQSTGHGTILVIDDEENLRTIAEAILIDCGYNVLTAGDGESGLKTYSRNRDSIRAVLLDLVMPGMSGKKVYEKLKEIDPEIKVILTSGFRDDSRIRSILRNGDIQFLQKPYNLKQLSNAVTITLS